MRLRSKQQHYLNAMGVIAWRERGGASEPSARDAVSIFALINQRQKTCGILLAELSADASPQAAQLKLIHAMGAALHCQLRLIEGIDASVSVVIALGAQAQQLVQTQPFRESARIVCADSAEALLEDPSKKAPLWRALKPLIAVLEQM